MNGNCSETQRQWRLGAVLLLICLAATWAFPSTLSADCNEAFRKFVLPVDLRQGVAFGRGLPRPYTFEASIAPSLAFGCAGRWNAGPLAATTFQNPEWEPGL